MEISINTHNVELTQRLRDHVERKTARLDRYMPNLVEVRVDLSSQNTKSAVQRQAAQITVRDDRGTFLRAEERDSDMFAAVDAVVDKLYRQIKRYRGKKIKGRRGGGSTVEEMALGEPLPLEFEEDEFEQEEHTIVRRKRFPLRPMAAEEAIEQMELLGHSFFVFFDVDDEMVNVVYKRHDDNYGLLQPEFD
ncbi:MAG: ribosome-associated translation inhibitor RaiA [Chloroflexota bacterium]|nr:MAG: ribosome-associated translation inhibitor RaiA [Chloroflexota bacterium]